MCLLCFVELGREPYFEIGASAFFWPGHAPFILHMLVQMEYVFKERQKVYLCEIITFDIAPPDIEITFDIFCN